MRICKPFFETGKVVVLESGFSCPKILPIHNLKNYTGYLIKRRFYCPKRIPGGLIDAHFQDKEVRDVDILEAIT